MIINNKISRLLSFIIIILSFPVIGKNNLPDSNENLIVNSSFEIISAPYMPDCWSNGYHYPAANKKFYNNIRVVKDNPYKGKYCFKIVNGKMRYLGNLFYKQQNTPLTLSLYLRTNIPGSALTVFNQTLYPEKTWKRYIVNVPSKSDTSFWVYAQGEVFLDALKLEKGNTPTKYNLNPIDIALTAPPLKPPTVPNKIINIPNTNIKDNKIPWNNGLPVNEFITYDGKNAKYPTKAYIVKGQKALHFRFECYGRSYNRLATNNSNNNGYVYLDDSVSIVLNPGISNGLDKAFIFDINSKEIKNTALDYDYNWDTQWFASAGPLPRGYWIEATIPFASIKTPFASDTWSINLIRNSAAKNNEKHEESAWFNTLTVPAIKTGRLVSGFAESKKHNISISSPNIRLSKLSNIFKEKLYSIIFEVGGPKIEHEGTAILYFSNGLKKEISWKPTDNKIELFFSYFSEKEIQNTGNYTLIIKNNEADNIAIKKYNGKIAIPPILEIGPTDRNYYTSEKAIGIKARINVMPELAKEMELYLELMENNKCLICKKYSPELSFIYFPFPANLAPGEYQLKASLKQKNNTTLIYTPKPLTIKKLPPSLMEVKINPINRMIVVDNKEKVNHGIAISSGATNLTTLTKTMLYLIPDIENIAERFTGISPLYTNLNNKPEATIKLLKQLVNIFYKAGLYTTFTIPSTESSNSFNPTDNFFKTHFDAIKKYKLNDLPVISWYQFDEAYSWWGKNKNNKEGQLEEFYNQLKKISPYKLLYTDTCYGNKVYGGLKSADWIGGSYYSISVFPPKNLPSGVRNSVMAIEKNRAKTNAPVVTGGFLPCLSYELGREPSVQEYRCCVYLMLIHGCRAMNAWMYAFFSETLWNSMIKLKKELQFLNPILAGGELISSKLTSSNRYIDFIAFKYKNKTYIIAANYSNEKIKAAFDLNLLENNNSAIEVFSNKNAVISNNILQDTFIGFAAHVYELK